MARLVKRYSNRKLYDTSESRYVTLDEIARWVKSGEEVKILENESGEDLTAVTFAQIILEEERKKSGLLSLRVMRELIQHGESALQGLAATQEHRRAAVPRHELGGAPEHHLDDPRVAVRSDEEQVVAAVAQHVDDALVGRPGEGLDRHRDLVGLEVALRLGQRAVAVAPV